MIPETALRVITARINGNFDNLEAMAWCVMYGPWTTCTLDDVAHIALLGLENDATEARLQSALASL